MWMMGCSDGSSGLHSTSDSFNGTRKLRPLIPRPGTFSATSTTARSSSSSCFRSIHNSTSDLFSLHNHLAKSCGATEKGKSEASRHPVSLRWNPTPEQLRTLEDLYRRGTRTPNATQIQDITAQLRRYGRIEGKNVFYWFQNHKARERQKRRRQAEAAMAMERDTESFEGKDAAISRTEGCKNWSPTNCSILSEESARSAPVSTKAERAREGRLQCDRELHLQIYPEGNATWHLMNLSPLPHLINTTPLTTTTTITTTTAHEEAAAAAAEDTKIPINGRLDYVINEYEQSETLELFPLHSSSSIEKTPASPPATSAMANLGPYQFFQFL